MTLWGVVAASFATLCCDRSGDVTMFYILRFLLGALEAGAFPAMYYYLTLHYDADEICVAYPRVTLATAVAGVAGGLLAAFFLSLDGALGLRGWQWVFLGEG
eukprot:5012326-Prymnesium_polylepis.1